MIPCNPCNNGKCGSCVAEKLYPRFIRNVNDHCGCAESGHKNNETVVKRPNVKGMFSKIKDNDPHIEESEVVEKFD